MNRHMKAIDNRGSLTVEAAVVMVIYILIIFIFFQAFFLLVTNVNTYCDERKQNISIERTVKNIRRWQFVR